jgi:mono/diheme cytochrome c family protein
MAMMFFFRWVQAVVQWASRARDRRQRGATGVTVVLVGAAAMVAAWPVGPASAAAEAGPAPTAQALEARFKSDVRPVLARYCFDCHADGAHKGDVSLDKYTDLASVQRAGKTWRHLIDVLNQRVMPPPKKKKRPTAEEIAAVTGWVGQALAWYDPAAPRDPGHVTIHRLNRNEYNNTVRDLVGVKDFKPADDFPADDTGYGFDNIADVLSMSPLLAEKYIGAAEQVLDQAILTRNPYERATKRYDSSKLEARGEGNTGGNLTKNGSTFVRHSFPCDGEYELRIRASQDPFGDEAAKMVVRLDRTDLKTFDVKNARGAKQEVYALKIDAKAGEHRVVAAYTNNKVDNDNPDEKKRGDRNLYVDYVEIDGPLNPPPPPLPESHRRIFVKSPGNGVSEEQAAREVVEHFATRAFRRPATKDEVGGLMKLYKLARAQGDGHESAVKLALTGVLVSPHFLFRIEVDPSEAGDKPHALSDYELATRLSYFLWSSMPDDALFDLAKSGKLHEKGTLKKQVKRMLADSKSAAFVSNFVGQWLETRNLDSYSPDPTKYPKFDNALRDAMGEEVELFFQTVLREDRSLLELVDADWTVLNERLAKHYGIDGVKGDEFRKVHLTDERRGGVLTMAGVLTVTAMPTRTSPVKRGKFVLEKILAAAPPPPPADIPPLDEKPEAVKAASVRERLEVHRANPNCAVCHVKMDAIGFSLENFDAVGRWREKDEAGHPIDASGKLPDGTALHSSADLKKVLLGGKEQFVHCLIENVLTYALGRGLEYYDQATVNDIAEKVKKDDYRLSSLVMAVIESEAFQERRAKRPGE